jgi:hypothetical protein
LIEVKHDLDDLSLLCFDSTAALKRAAVTAGEVVVFGGKLWVFD